MNDHERKAFIIALVDALSRDGWVGKTHVQKTMYFAQEAAGVDLGYRFVIHHYGPYSFELESQIQTLESQDVLSITPEIDGYGYKVSVGNAASEADVPADVKSRAEHIAGYFAGRQAVELELISTALYVQRRLPNANRSRWIDETRRLKPKFSQKQVMDALEESASLATELKS